MEEFKLVIKGISLTRSELNAADAELLKLAEDASKNAYAPYSQFYVGAALRLESGTTVLGTNQENVAYPSGLCAERVAIFSASTNYPNERIETMAITVNTAKSAIVNPLSPCGNCRQVIMEYQHKQQSPIRLILASQSDKVWIFEDAASLLPFGFEADYLKNS
ncbi:MAG: cytidine deaminase [Flavobacteriales bacterium]|nr:cytidine deaminase [Flavobacteriales bacterium]